MAKTATAKPAKARTLAKSKGLLSKPVSLKTKATTSEEQPLLSKKAEGKRKSSSAAIEEQDAHPTKQSKKAAKPLAQGEETAVGPTGVESSASVKGSKQVKEPLAKGGPSEKLRTKPGKKEIKQAEETDEQAGAQEEVRSSTKSSVKSSDKSKKFLSAAPKSYKDAAAIAETNGEEDVQSDEEKEKEDGFDEQDTHLFGFSTDDDDSSDDEMDGEPDAIEVSKLPTIAKDDATVKQKLEKAKRKPTADRGVLYLGRIPHGFYEAQMKSYFSQFGEVTRLRLSRNKKTGRSKHYAFIEFDSSSVAQIVAETMDNYLLMGHILTCKVIPKDEVHPELWLGANRKWRAIPTARVARVKHNKVRTEEQQEKAEKRLIKRQSQKKRKLEEAGIKYDFDAVAYKKRPKSAE